MSVILVGGSPGTGKTAVAKILASKLSVEAISLSELANESGCVTAEDKARNTGIIDEDCLVEALLDLTDNRSRRMVIEGHYIDLVPSSSVQWIFILRTRPEILKDRLTKRNYSREKVIENVEAEVIGVCQLDAIDSFGESRVFEIDTSELSASQTVEKIEELMKNKSIPTRIDWMSMLEDEGRLDEFLTD